MSEIDLTCTVEEAQLRAPQSSEAVLLDSRDVRDFVRAQNSEQTGGEKGRTRGGTDQFGICTIDGLEEAKPRADVSEGASVSPVPARSGDSPPGGARSRITGEYDLLKRCEAIFKAPGLFNDDEAAVYNALDGTSLKEMRELQDLFQKTYGKTVYEYLDTFLNDSEMAKAVELMAQPLTEITQNDTKVQDESKTWSELAQSDLLYGRSSEMTEKALQQLVVNLVDFTESKTMSDNAGWEAVWTNVIAAHDIVINAVRSDAKGLYPQSTFDANEIVEMAQILAGAYNEQAAKVGSTVRVSLKLGTDQEGHRFLTVSRDCAPEDEQRISKPIIVYPLIYGDTR